ncbi:MULTISPECIES: STAS domain-containing protein [unclassified Streptomyces]|uniref:STAS domain-containing protein n=1 Tax=unclassified Streptomyces TaxID=2593676 RepID=UPI0036B417C2
MTDLDHTLIVTPRQIPSGPYVLEVTGGLDYHTAQLLTAAINDAPLQGQGLVIDLSGLTYCDSTGITVLVIAYQKARAADSTFGLAGVSPHQMRVFQVVGLDQIFTFHATAEAAASALRP